MADKSAAANLGPWAQDDFAATVRENTAAGDDADLPQDIRFVSGVARLIRLRLAGQHKSDLKELAVFLLQPVVPNLEPAPKRIPMLNNGRTALTGRLWFVNAVVVMGHFIEIGNRDDDAVFQWVTDHLELGGVPAIIFDPRGSIPEVRFYAEGLSYPENYRQIEIASIDLSLDRIVKEADHVYRNHLITPEAQDYTAKLWTNQEKWWVAEKAEALVQMYLKVGLSSALPTCKVRAEQVQISGRLDLEVEEQNDPTDRSRFTRHALLELKVLSSYGSTGSAVSENETLLWIEKGVKQAAEYREERGALASALLCFDMRKDDTNDSCFEHVKTLAADWSVRLKRWFLYAKSEHYRDAVIQ